ncbi:unnamed protein product [Penicillium nalgiovense]|uniref:Uncharacterized protein n=1 Tax=Penicillium nalgiovense TaxID=60175 RepID=A0A9W4MMH3_PENNA|nr:unnamed protein product [Penicillium nalgiovense]CAG8022801.1 unnamed protein product [Penicillium salamii]CAG8001256.1 unnamed protein product [Penicillium nalgiovense]CAG8004678.1 unnamed protein product [Penicillium nalgiovense]CAG8025137.1 unnamed protein product [Penicillium nalgiovense]
MRQRTLRLSGTLDLDPTSGNLIESSVADRTDQIFWNMSAIIKAGGYGLKDTVSCHMPEGLYMLLFIVPAPPRSKSTSFSRACQISKQ